MPYLTNNQKQPSGAVFGFANLLVKLIVEQKPDYLAVAFDHARKTFRNEIYADYKGTRKDTPADLLSQFPVIKELLQTMKIKVFEFSGIEADDIIGTLSKISGQENILVSGDRDLLQLISSQTKVWLTRKGVTDVEIFDEKALFEMWKVSPRGVVDLKALMGDASDNIPGVSGVGEKTAMTLMEKYKSLDAIYENIDEISGKLKDKLESGKELAKLSQTLATIKTDCDIDFHLDDCKLIFPFNSDVRDFFVRWNFKSLAGRKDIFDESVELKKKSVETIQLKSLADVANFAEKVGNVFCYDLNNLIFSFGNGQRYSVKKEYDLFSDNLETNDVLLQLKNVFENENVQKITNSAKSDYKILKKLGIELKNVFDIDLSRYLLFAGLPKLDIPELEDYVTLKADLEKQMKEQGLWNLYNDVEMPLSRILVQMEDEGFRVDEKQLQELSEQYKNRLNELSSQIYELSGETFNINSPKQVADILFDKLGLPSWNNKKRSTSVEILEDMIDEHEIVGLIIQHRKLSKLINTYLNVYQEIVNSSGDVVHTCFNQTLTATGRLSSSEPNMQNIPTRNEEGKNLRKIFISKYEDGEIISADYSQIELRLLANMANEEHMISAFKSGVDIHTKTASEIFGVPIEEVSASQRREAKAVNFGIIYGISDYGLSQNIKTSVNRAKKYIESYFDRYPNIKIFMDKNVAYARENGYVKSYFGRIRHIPEINSSNYVTRKFGERVAMNMPLQGTASDIIKIAMVEMGKRMQGLRSHLILQVHDELIVDAPKDEVETIKKMLKEVMESVCDFDVKLTVSVSSGKNLFECK